MVTKSVFSFARVIVVLGLLTGVTRGQERVGNPPNTADRTHPTPVQTYAVIDISGSTATSPVTRVALNDYNRVAFGFGVDPDNTVLHRSYSKYDTYTWQNGTLGQKQTTTLVTQNSADDTSYIFTTRHVDGICSNGTTYGSQSRFTYFIANQSTEDGKDCGFRNPGGEVDLPAPFVNGGEQYAVRLYDVSENGFAVGSAIVGVTPIQGAVHFNASPCFQFKPDGSIIIFDGTTDYTNASPFPQTLEDVNVGVERVNVNGWMVGEDYQNHGKLWKGSQPCVDFGIDIPIDLNDQGQVVVSSAVAYSSSGGSYLWDNNAKIVLASCLPRALIGQLTNIQPFSISNQVALAPSANTDATIHVLATAKDNGAGVTVVCTRDNAGAWTFAEIQLPEGVTISDFTTINSSGIIAAIGNAGTGDGHALMLVPINFKVTNWQPNIADALVVPIDFIGDSHRAACLVRVEDEHGARFPQSQAAANPHHA